MVAKRAINSLLLYLLLTVVLEAACGFAIGARKKAEQITILLANLITNPLMNALLLIVQFYISFGAYYYFFVPFEIIVIIVEGIIYKKNLELKLNPFVFSLLLNACSLALGTIALNIIR